MICFVHCFISGYFIPHTFYTWVCHWPQREQTTTRFTPFRKLLHPPMDSVKGRSIRQAMRSNATNCSEGVSVFSNRDQMNRYDPIRWDDTTRSVETVRPGRFRRRFTKLPVIVELMVRVEHQRPRRCNSAREGVRRWATTFTSTRLARRDVRRWTTTFPFRGRLAE